MKVQKTNLRHWWYLMRGGVNTVSAIAVRRLSRRRNNAVVFYGHTFNGNLRAFAGHVQRQGELDCYFATLDPHYYAELAQDHAAPGRPLSLLRLRDAMTIARCRAVVTDRKAHVLELFNRYSSAPFIDVWHGVPFKGFTHQSFRYLDDYEEVWVSSAGMRDIYRDRFAVPEDKLQATGYARQDAVLELASEGARLRAKYGIEPGFSRVVLVAPTWQQDDKGRSIVPFGLSAEEFFSLMDEVGREHHTLFVFRAHLNVDGADRMPSLSHVVNMPYALYPEAEDFLAMADVLVTDWSSIAFDYLALRRPMIFLDVPPPFKDGLTLGEEHRCGPVVSSAQQFRESLAETLTRPKDVVKRYAKQMERTTRLAYGDTLDGKVGERQYSRLTALI